MEENFEFYNETLYELRKSKGMSQEEFAEKIGVSRQSIYAWESGKSLPDIENLYKMCQVLEVDTNKLTNLSSTKKETKPKIDKKKIKKAIIITLIVFIVIYLIIAFRHFIIVSNISKKIENIEDYDNYSYNYVKAELYKDDNSKAVSQEVYYKEGILKVIVETTDEVTIQWTDFNNNEEYIFVESNNEKSVRKYRNENLGIQKQIYSIRSISNNGLISKNSFKNFIASILFPFSYKVKSTGKHYVLEYESNNWYFKYNNVQFINKENGFPIENQEYRNDGKAVFEKYKDIKINETTDEDVKLPNLNEYTLIED